LATVLLAKATGKRQNRHLFARQLLIRSPAVALATAFGEGDERHFSIAKPLLPFFVEFLMASGLQVVDSEKGGLAMDELLRDAAFLADRNKGIMHFCVNPSDRLHFLTNLTRHTASKPISQALDTLLRGHEIDIARQTFRNHLHDYVPGEESADLLAFITGVDRIIERFESIRKTSITDFIRAKNALTASVYTFTKYPNLIETIREEAPNATEPAG
jgi:hypothetical protein